MASKTCVYCGAALIQTGYGGLCLEHSKDLLAELEKQANTGVVRPKLAAKQEEAYYDLQKYRVDQARKRGEVAD